MDPLALWGAITGTLGTAIAGTREALNRRRNLTVGLGSRINLSRVEPVGNLTHAWASIELWNRGGRSLAVERVGFEFSWQGGEDASVHTRRAEMYLTTPVELPADGPTRKLHTPLGPMLRAGINPFVGLRAYAITQGRREWLSNPRPLILSLPSPDLSPRDLFMKGLKRLGDEAEPPPAVEDVFALKCDEPFLPGEIDIES